MKQTLVMGVSVLIAGLMAHAEEVKRINVKDLADEKVNISVVAPPELGAKPVTISAEAVAEKAKAPTLDAAQMQSETDKNPSNVKDFLDKDMVIPPSVEKAATLEAAIRDILRQACKQIGTVSSNGVEKLTMPYQQLGDGKGYEVEWRKALRLLLSPVGYNFTEDEDLVLLGLTEEVDIKHKQLAQERLTNNRTPILFTTNERVGGVELRNAIRDVAVKAHVTITTDNMDPADLYVPVQTVTTGEALSVNEIGKAEAKSNAQQIQVKRTTFDTNGQQIEWRIVLREILNPYEYDFVEVGGVVRIAKRAKIAQWEQEAMAKKPLTAKVIRLYHADPEEVVKRVMTIKGLLRHPNASLQATRKKDDNTETVKNLNARIQTSSGQQSGMSDTTSQIFDKLVRPRTVPAIIAYDVEENMANIEAKIKLFDIKEKQILIEAIIFQLDTDNGNGDMDGVKWSGFENFFPLYGSLGNVANVADTFSDMTRDGFKVHRGDKIWLNTDGVDFKAMIQLIRERDNSKLLANPMIVVGDHSEAAIQVSNVDPIPQVDASTVSSLQSTSDNVQNSINIQWNMLRSGILMWVAPEITEFGSSVRLTVHPQVVTKGDKVDLSKLDEGNPTSIFKKYPVYNYELKMHEMDTRATVPSGSTLMFGGLIDTEEIEKETKVRWLGDIPLIGWFFRSTVKELKQKNLIIMIRPTILEDTDETGYEKPALKETESVLVNTGRDLKKTPNGPYSVKEITSRLDDFIDERVIKPFQDDVAPSDAGDGNATPPTTTP